MNATHQGYKRRRNKNKGDHRGSREWTKYHTRRGYTQGKDEGEKWPRNQRKQRSSFPFVSDIRLLSLGNKYTLRSLITVVAPDSKAHTPITQHRLQVSQENGTSFTDGQESTTKDVGATGNLVLTKSLADWVQNLLQEGFVFRMLSSPKCYMDTTGRKLWPNCRHERQGGGP